MDKVSGVKSEKSEHEKLIQDYAHSGDTIVVWRLDRLGRSTVNVVQFTEELKKKGINIKFLTEPIYTASATGIMFYQFACVMAEHERMY